MKPIFSLIAVTLLLVGCGGDRRAETEQKLAETQQKLDEATKALEAAQEAAVKEMPAMKPESQTMLTKAQDHVKTTAGHVEAAAKEAKTVAAEEKDKGLAEVTHKSAAVAEKRAQEARKMAEPPKMHTVAAGTAITVRTLTPMSTKTTEVGSSFEASLIEPIEVDGYVVADKGAMVEGVVTQSDPGGKVKGLASLGLELKRLKLSDGKSVAISTKDVYQVANSSKKKDALKIGIAAGIGAAIGAIAGGGKGAAIGAGAGAAGGTGYTLATRGDAAVLPVESLLKFSLAESINVVEVHRKSVFQ